jgi:hypothetical protein
VSKFVRPYCQKPTVNEDSSPSDLAQIRALGGGGDMIRLANRPALISPEELCTKTLRSSSVARSAMDGTSQVRSRGGVRLLRFC